MNYHNKVKISGGFKGTWVPLLGSLTGFPYLIIFAFYIQTNK